MTTPTIKRALISVADKTNVVEFAKALTGLGIELISTGGTSKLLADAGILHSRIEELTGLPEMLDGRIKTLHPVVHGGILGRRDADAHQRELNQLQIPWIDLVVVNFYQFAKHVAHTTPLDEAVEYIDIGGPTMVRAAAKNFAWVSVVVDPQDYERVIQQLRQGNNGLDHNMRIHLARKAFDLTAQYDELIRQYFAVHDINQHANQHAHQHADDSHSHIDQPPKQIKLSLEKFADLRYGENPHQTATAYRIADAAETDGILHANILQGKVLSYNNMLDAEAAWACVSEFIDSPACVIVKHANPCGASCAQTITQAFQMAYAADAQSAFGGIVAINRPCTKELADIIATKFIEVLIAPDYSHDAKLILATKPNLRVLQMNCVQAQTKSQTQSQSQQKRWEMKHITGGFLRQEKNTHTLQAHDLQIVTKLSPTQEDIEAMLFAWHVLKHIKSNGILIAKQQVTLGIGAGQVSRIDAVDLALRKAGSDMYAAVLASDAFFPFRDSVDRIAMSGGVRAIIQPGGSKKDEEVISACNQHGIAMVFTGARCFRH